MNLQKPVNKPNLKITSPFGRRFHPIEKVWKGHCGIDIMVPKSTKVLSVADGIVVITSELKGYGNVIYIDHGIINGQKVETRYAHLSKFNVKPWQKVEAGQEIARSGGIPGEAGSGSSTGAHLHFEVRINGEPKDPLDYLC